jgi:hypothetical protein
VTPDMNTHVAVQTVALQVLAKLAADVVEQWESYPEIGQHDWENVIRKVLALAPYPADSDYTAAYALLQSRAGDVT